MLPPKIACAYDEVLPLSSLKPHPKNRNKHPKDQIALFAKILSAQGCRRPVRVSNLSGHMTVGHGMVEAAKLLQWESLPVDYQDYESVEQEYADMVADNALAAWATIDLAGVNTDLPDLGPDFDINLLGIKDFTLDIAEKEFLTDPDALPEKVETKVRLGQIWGLGDHRLMCGDSTSKEQVGKLLKDASISVWLSDPPYGINHVEVSQEKGQSKGYAKIANDDLEDEKFKEFIFQAISVSLPYTKEGFAFYMWHAMKMQGYTAAAAAAAAGILFHRQIIWVKPQFVFGRGHYHWRHELCLMGWKQGNEPPFFGERNQSTIWEAKRENDKIHPTQKPVEILEPSILNHTKPAEHIYDPFLGSGSTLIASEKTNRKCYGMELSPEYCDVIIARWEKYTGLEAKLLG